MRSKGKESLMPKNIKTSVYIALGLLYFLAHFYIAMHLPLDCEPGCIQEP
jgi:hypothetical protein